MLQQLKKEVYEANMALQRYGLVTLTWGNVSAINRQEGLIVIKPSGVPYETLSPADMVVVDMDGKKKEGKFNPSSDTATHLHLYQTFDQVSGIAHTHSTYATIFAQARREIPCFGTTHADYFKGTIPLTRMLTPKEVEKGYENNTGLVITERFAELDAVDLPAVLVAGHGPFSWGNSAAQAVENSLVLEKVAQLAFHTLHLQPDQQPLPEYILKKHYLRKHGPDAYYGQKKKS